MASKYPRYCREQKGKLYYQRDFPVSMRKYGKKTYTKPLGLSANDYKASQLQLAIANATEAYELTLKMMTSTSIED